VAASSAPPNISREIGESDLDALKAIRTLAESHVTQALKLVGEDLAVLRAASDPYDFIDLAWIDEFGLLAEDLWVRGFDLIEEIFGIRMGMTLAPRNVVLGIGQQAVAQARESYLDLLSALIEKHAYPLKGEPVLGEFRTGNAVQYGDVRGLLVKLGGGSTSPEISLVGGITTGTTMQDYLAETGINTNEKIWLYGWEEQPRRTFNGHLQMDGLVFEDWDDNGLIISPQDRWLRRNYYAPGDHFGCACVVAPYFPNMDEPFAI
jgi:hypothetical protein